MMRNKGFLLFHFSFSANLFSGIVERDDFDDHSRRGYIPRV